MTDRDTPSDVVGRRIRELRKRRGWSLAELAQACAEKAGAGQLSANVIDNIEHGRRKDGKRRRTVSVDELLIFADVFDVAPVHLLVPIEDTEYAPTPDRVEGSRAVRDWIRGIYGLEGTDLRDFTSEVPKHEFGQFRWPENVMYERLGDDGKPFERVTASRGSLEDLRMSRSPRHRRVDADSEGGSHGQG